MGTPVSGVSAYATPANMTDRFDVRTIGELLSDTAVALDPTAVANSTKLTALLQEASGMVESAVLVGDRYQLSDLAALTGNSQQTLVGIVCRVTMFLLWERRPSIKMAKMELPASAEMAMRLLDQIAAGMRAFGIQEVLDADIPPDPEFMTRHELRVRNSVSVGARRLFGDRNQFHAGGR